MRLKFTNWLIWVAKRPLIVVNLLFLAALVAIFAYLLTKPIDVLQNWVVNITDVKVYRGDRPVFNPGDTLVFNSKSDKIVNTEGTTTRTLVCEATSTLKAREIQLDTVPATRPKGTNPPRDNAITIPDVTQFDGLPRDCYLSFDVCYKDVVLWRDHCEHNQTIHFIVEEEVLDAGQLRQQILRLNDQVNQLTQKLQLLGVSTDTEPL